MYVCIVARLSMSVLVLEGVHTYQCLDVYMVVLVLVGVRMYLSLCAYVCIGAC